VKSHVKSRAKKSKVYPTDKIACSSLSMSEKRVLIHIEYCGIVLLYIETEEVFSVA
jgi:hypothetical protein